MSSKKLPKKSHEQEQLMKEKLEAAEAIHHEVRHLYHEVLKNAYAYYSPMVVSKLLIALKKLRHSLEEIQQLPMRTQEELAWLILNACKLIYDIAQPLIWNSCGKYVIETLGFAVLSMEAVINLCTIKHMNFRMKLYASMIYCGLSQGNLDQAQGTWDHCQKEIKELVEREELDPPLPDKSILCISESLEDLFMLKFVIDCWRDNDAINFTDNHVEKYRTLVTGGSKYYRVSGDIVHTLRNRMVTELARVHLLSSGNANETYLKRSASLVKAMQLSILDKKGESGEGLLTTFTVQSLFEIAYVTIIDGESMTEDTFNMYRHILENSDLATSKDFKQKLDILVSLQNIINNSGKLDSETILKLKVFVQQLNDILYTESSYRTKSVYIKISLDLFRKVIYKPIQKMLSEKNPKNEKFFKMIAYPLQTLVKVLDLTFAEDPIITGSMALLCGHVLFYVKEYREAISILKQALSSTEDHRASRIDFLSQLPEDVRDILALQRNSFTTKSDMNDWFNSVKRLGAHAFAGFGIFGLGSSADRSDQALAELHADILSMYFRVELHYGYLYFRDRTIHRKEKVLQTQQQEAAKMDTTTKKPVGKGTTQKKDGGSAIAVTKKVSLLPVDFRVEVNVEKLPAVQALRAFCAKNKYALTILNLEMAKLESDSNRRLKYLGDAKSCIEEAEQQEENLIAAFQNLTIMTDTAKKYPIVLSRSHRYIYVSPVACRNQKKALYYKVLAKEKGSGTDVSIYNDDMPGCDVRIPTEKFVDFKDIVVRVGPLRNGELYVFGSAGYTDSDQVTGGVSPTTPVVEAVNPLPTILLWSYLAESSHVLGYGDLSMDAAVRVCNRFILKTPVRNIISMTNGVNLFLYEESTICALALQQSTPNLLQQFVNSFILYETLKFHKELFGREIKWNHKHNVQLRYLTSLNRVAAVVAVTTSLANQDLTVKCICLGSMLLVELLKFDEVPLARYLQSSVTTFLIALQRIAKKHWHDLEHKLYYKLTAQLLQLGVINRDIGPVVSIINEFYPESREKTIEDLNRPSMFIFQHIESLVLTIEQMLAPVHRESLIGDLKKLYLGTEEQKTAESPRGPDIVASFWKLTPIQRKLRVSNFAMEMSEAPTDKASPERLKLEKNLQMDLPQNYSDYLAVVVQWMKDLFNRNHLELIEKLIQRTPLCLDYFSATVQSLLQQWKVVLVMPLSDFVNTKLAAAESAAGGGGKKAPPKKGAEPDVSLGDLLAVPERFKSAAADESNLQMSYFAEILQLLVMANAQFPGKVNYFIKSYHGPLRQIETGSNDYTQSNEEKGESVVKSETDAARKGAVNKCDAVKYFMVAMDLFAKAGQWNAAVNAIVKLWNLLVAEYLDPLLFLQEYQELTSLLLMTFTSLSEVIDKISSQRSGLETINPLLLKFAETDSASPTTLVENSEYSVRECREKLSVLADVAIFLVKSVWLIGKYSEDIVIYSSRIFTLYLLNADVDVTMKFGEAALPLVRQSQENLIAIANSDLDEAKAVSQKFTSDYEEAQQKKRKKKLRVARLEKDEEELAFEAEKQRLEDIVAVKLSFVKKREEEMEYVNTQQHTFQNMIPKGQQLLQKAKKSLHNFIHNIEADYGKFVDFRVLLHPVATNTAVQHASSGGSTSSTKVKRLHDSIEDVNGHYKRAIKYLRENKEKVALTEALQDIANLYIRFGLFNDAKQFLFDIVDGLFNTMDACLNWRTVCDQAKQSFDFHLIPGIVNVIIALSKLSKYYTYEDYETKAAYARMASELSLLFYEESIHHPKVLFGFSAYECIELGGFQSFPVSYFHEIFVALNDLIPVLMFEDQDLLAFPLIVLGEHIAGVYLRNARLWLDMRRFRVRALVQRHCFAEAISMLSGIKSRVQSIYEHSFADFLRKPSSADSENLPAFELSKNGLCFNGVPPFYNNQLPNILSTDPSGSATDNAKSLEWVATAAGDLETFLGKFIIRVPESELTEEDKQKLAIQRQKAQDEAAELLKKNKGKGPPPAEYNPEADLPILKLFTSPQIADLYLLCGHLLLELATMDGSSQNLKSLADFRLKQITASKVLLGKAREVLYNNFSTNDVEEDYGLRLVLPPAVIDQPSSPRGAVGQDLIFIRLDWFDLCGRLMLLENRTTIYLRHYRQALLAIHTYMKLLQHPNFNTADIRGDMKYYLSFYWMQCRLFLIHLSRKQAKLDLGLDLIGVSLTETAVVNYSFWTRRFLSIRSKIRHMLKDYDGSLSDCTEVIQLYQKVHVEEVTTVEMKVHHANLLKEKSRYYNAGLLGIKDERGEAYYLYNIIRETLDILRAAYAMGKRVMERSGGLPVDYNVTFARAESNISGYHLLPPPLHGFTDIHNNELPLTVTAMEVNNFENQLLKGNRGLTRSQVLLSQAIRLGPVDVNDYTFTPSEYCNIYLTESRVLLTCQVSMLILLDDIRCMGVGNWMTSLIDQIVEEKNSGMSKKKPIIDLDEENLELLNEKDILFEEISIGEESLKLLRQVVFAPPAIRGKVYLYAAKARIARRAPPAPGLEAEHQQTLLGPLVIGLQYLSGVGASYLWTILKAMCVELVEVFGDDSLELGDDQPTRIKQALLFLNLAITANNQLRKVTEGTLDLCVDPSFSTVAIPEELSRILINVFNSSMATPLPNMHPAAAAAAVPVEAVGKDAKGKAPPKGAATGVAATSYVFNGRDAVYLLSSLSREVNQFYCDGDSNDLSFDVHLLLKKTFPVYDAQCCINAIPSSKDNISIPSTSVSTLWKLVSTPKSWNETKMANADHDSNSVTKESKAAMDSVFGFYSHAALFLVLGDAKVAAPVAPPAKGAKVDPNAAAAPAASIDPVLTKVVLYRGDILRIEKGLRTLREKFIAIESSAANNEQYLPLAKEFGTLSYFVITMLRFGFISSEAEHAAHWTDATFSVTEGVIKLQVEKVNVTLPFNRKVLTNLANCFTQQRDMFQIQDPDVCIFLRYALGHKTT